MMYQSTRDKNNQVTASQAILKGLASDGGLYVPMDWPNSPLDFKRLAEKSYQEVAYDVMSAFLTDFTEEELKRCIQAAYDEKFEDKQIAPLKKVDGVYYLELFHGATIAFKDMALSILPHLMTTAAKKNGVEKEIVILTATSGDTGKAAMAGFSDVAGTQIIVFYPKYGVSAIQEKQMVTQVGSNTNVIGITGNFDDAQTNVKAMFNNVALNERLDKKGYQFSSANSINIGRLVPQIVYYVYSYAQLIKNKTINPGEKINVSVPTGNFGNILAGYYAKQIGVPIEQLICASNENKVLTDFFQTGVYDKNREFFVTTSPSMDILLSSNLERLIYHLTDDNTEQTKIFMEELQTTGTYTISQKMRDSLTEFYAEYATKEETLTEIGRSWKESNYLMDPHTAVAANVYQKYIDETKDKQPVVVVSTASPYKFPQAVLEGIGEKVGSDDFANVKTLHQTTKLPIPLAVSQIEEAPVLHHTVVKSEEMQEVVETLLKLKE